MFNFNPVFYDVNAYRQWREQSSNYSADNQASSSDTSAQTDTYNVESLRQALPDREDSPPRYPSPERVNNDWHSTDSTPYQGGVPMPYAGGYHHLEELEDGTLVVVVKVPAHAGSLPVPPPWLGGIPPSASLSQFSAGYGASTTPLEGATLRFERGEGWNESGCAVACIAMVAGVSYETAREKAKSIGNYDHTEGLTFKKAKKILKSMNIESSVYTQSGKWSDLPDLAFVSVLGSNSNSHAVVFERNGDKEIIYDWKNRGPVYRTSDYKLREGRTYLEIHR
ncbi:cysteine peptidase family C39 domain-containing protein [Brenneria rubrifaciens]|uniref:cysteine peptidase family C39 domain-containing protein n=1 Tax=Brenneria rubrifaciens TaxID=55213 RepID=UPI00158670B3|nr:cysteine peptidase family C39 domain-containing protein [Brenneria rubrifaciens]